MNVPLIDLKAQYENIKIELNDIVLGVLSSTDYIMGGQVKYFEKEFASYLGVKNAISVANGTDALVIAMKSLGIGEGDEVITTPYTFFSTAESISAVGAKPIFVDVDIDTFNIDASKLEDKITKRTRAIIPVHIFGQPADMNEILNIARRNNLFVIEDACQAIGAEYYGRKIGTLGDIGCFSFFPTKNLGCAGDGGMIVTNDDNIATIVKALRVHGSGENGEKAYNLLNDIEAPILQEKNNDNTIYNPLKYYNFIIGFNSRLDEIQAAILRVKLKNIDMWNEKRIKNAAFYNKSITNKSIFKPVEVNDKKHVYHMYVIQSEYRDKLTLYLKERNIATGIYYPVPVHLQKVYHNLGYKAGDMPVAEYLSRRTLAIPIYPELSIEQKLYIVNVINDFEVDKKNEK